MEWARRAVPAKRAALVDRSGGRRPLEGSTARITRRDLVDREIAFEHAALSADQFYAGLDLGLERVASCRPSGRASDWCASGGAGASRRTPWRRCCGRSACRPAGRGTCSRCRRAARDDGADRRSAARAPAPPRSPWRPRHGRAMTLPSGCFGSVHGFLTGSVPCRSSRRGPRSLSSRRRESAPRSGSAGRPCPCRAPCRPGSRWRCRGPSVTMSRR